MIYFVLERSNSNTIRKYLQFRGEPMVGTIEVICYDEIEKLNGLSCSTLIFSDFDRLTSSQLTEVTKIFNQLKQKYPTLHILNNPSKVKLRYDLLTELYNRGINPYKVHRLSGNWDGIKFPVFVREENNHTGALSALIYSHKKLEQNVLALNMQGYPTKNLLATEFVDVSAKQGVFKKYSALKLQNEVFPRQVDYNFHWMVKTSIRFNKYPKEEFLKEFTDYMHNHPHEKILTDLFEIAQIDYGRIDYGMLNGNPVVWEINLNPDYGGKKNKKNEIREDTVHQLRDEFHKKFREKFFELDKSVETKIDFYISKETKRLLQPRKTEQIIRLWHNKLTTKKPFFKMLLKIMRKGFLLLAIILLPILQFLGIKRLKR